MAMAMASPYSSVIVITVVCAIAATTSTQVRAQQLSHGFYNASCPGAERVVAGVIRASAAVDLFLPPKLLRLFFHDCFLHGCDGSILIDSTPNNPAEKSDPANLSVDGYGAIDSAKTVLESLCPGIVSCADIVALAARDSVVMMGGPSFSIPTGRRDGLLSNASSVRANVPDTTFNLDQLLQNFGSKGLSMNDLIILSGAHTIGRAHCTAFNDRFKFSSNGTTFADESLNPNLARTLLQACPQNFNPSTTVFNDLTTAVTFDNAYYQNLQQGMGLFASDQILFRDSRSRAFVTKLAQNQTFFFSAWQQSMLKLGRTEVKTGNQGEIRKHCRAVN